MLICMDNILSYEIFGTDHDYPIDKMAEETCITISGLFYQFVAVLFYYSLTCHLINLVFLQENFILNTVIYLWIIPVDVTICNIKFLLLKNYFTYQFSTSQLISSLPSSGQSLLSDFLI